MAKASKIVAKVTKAILQPKPSPAPKAAANAIAPDVKERNAKIADLWRQLNENKGDRGIGRKTRRALRALGHRGGLATPPPAV